MSHTNDATISSSSSWIPYTPSNGHHSVHNLESSVDELSTDYFPESHAGSSSPRPTPKLSTSFMVAPELGSRPSLGRSATSPHLRTGKRHSTIPRINTAHTPRQWSVFAQLMENEGQITPKSASFKRTRGPGSVTSGDTTPRESILDSYVSADVQSPINEDEHFAGGRTPADSDLDSESVSGSDSEESSRASPIEQDEPQPKWYSFRKRLPTISVLHRNIFKCAVAYFVASLFTFNPFLAGFLSDVVSGGSRQHRPLSSAHMVATVAVYFNPAKTMGGMIEADFFFLFGVFYSAFICLSSMTMFWWLDVHRGWEWLADLLAIIWVGVGMSFLAWMKVYMANPQFNTASSMMSIIIFVVLVKEGGLNVLLQVSFIVFCGAVVSNLVCYLIWPQSATDSLRSNMMKTLDSFSTLLGMLTDTFLLEEPLHPRSQGRIQRAVEAHQSSFTSLKKNLKEARSEWIFWGRYRTPSTSARFTSGAGPIRDPDSDDAVDSMNRLAQHLNGLRSGTRLQFELTQAGAVERIAKKSKRKSGTAPSKTGPLVDIPLPEQVIEEDDEEAAMLKAAAVMFGDLVDDLGPPMKSLSTTCTNGLKRLRESIHHSQHAFQRRRRRHGDFHFSEFNGLIEGIEAALLRFESTSNHAVMRLYRKSDLIRLSSPHTRESMPTTPSSLQRPNTVMSMADNVFTAVGDGTEHVFLVYFFIFTLQEFAREMAMLVDAMERIYAIEQERLTWSRWTSRLYDAVKKSWTTGRLDGSGPNVKKGGLRKRISRIIVPQQRSFRPVFPKVTPHAPDTIQTPSRKNLNFIGRMKQGIWSLGKRLNERDTKFAVKAGMATAILAAPAFFDYTRAFFVKYYGDWALISFFVVMSPTIGATNFLGLHRILATLFGAAVAAGIISLFPENPIVLSIFGFFFSIPCFYYLIGKPVYASAARFVLLTYNLTCLYCYNINRQDSDMSVVVIAYYRALSVTAGVIWAALVSRFWWPAEARRELSKALGDFCLNVGWLYTRLVMSNSFTPEYTDETPVDPRTPSTSSDDSLERPRVNSSIKEFMAMELHLQIKLFELQALLAQAQHEPRLKGPFPVALYRGILTSLQTILDKLHSMRCVTTREEWFSVRQDFIIPVNKERRDMVGNIILFFSTLASAFRLKAPLPPYLPPAEESRQRLVQAIRQLEVVRNRDVKGSRQLLFFAYAMAMKEAFGVIGQSTAEFDALFLDTENTRTSY
ncbi:Fusaric acid resistance protein-like-domain-containing protein [Rhodocollybia butyracea]|uniref:Fusaric acid resistance protein-like-domain-containing protein n=1 Tax=Rhodocollybia butyracea TaxID=206335 RepID=A0A9P5PE34_9AGAR|nr:Fusaric acid resistance protein-like-domain-containing protein [Rhodocollybia butyracea]